MDDEPIPLTPEEQKVAEFDAAAEVRDTAAAARIEEIAEIRERKNALRNPQ